ncbi:protease modulator HflC [Silanimonas sp.]|uniref:protease modulator HflC n=1 Tax=Silanimonas sp. TaxID=1929290 RepID=UPI0022C917F0|nr:protease modulator HflC [Silanimonas sp.]MCZ8164807.1 protease modulator HflC [Silanimonas sp.]
MRQLPNILIAAALAILLLMGSVFTVDQTDTAIVLRLGEVVREDVQPGLRFKVPLIETVRTFDRRLLTMTADNKRYLTSEQQDVQVDYFVAWRIENVAQYYRAAGGGIESQAITRLSPIVEGALRSLINRSTLRQLAEAGRRDSTAGLIDEINKGAATLGIQVADVRIKRIDLPDDGASGTESVLDRVFNRMRADREEVATRTRAEGNERAEKIRAEADQQAQVILANAERDAAKIRGEGDAKAAEIYAGAYGKDAEFYAFHRSLEAYRGALADGKTTLVLDPDSEFFEYFEQARR